MRPSRAWLLGVLVSLLAASPGRADDGFAPDPDGWIRHWIIYGLIGNFPGPRTPNHPVTGESLIFSDFIAEAPGTEGRRTEADFLPEPYLEIDTEFGTVAPGHELRTEPRPGLNPNGKPMGIPWAVGSNDCNVWFNLVFLRTPLKVGGPVENGIVYAYAYVENTTDETIRAYPTFGFGAVAQMLFRSLERDPVLEPFAFYPLELGWAEVCTDGAGPPLPDGEERPEYVETEPLDIAPGLNLLLVKVHSFFDLGAVRFRFRDADPPHDPIAGDRLRIHLTPDPDEPAPPLFRRLDVNGVGGVEISDAVRTLRFLFVGGEGTLPCPDAADVDDDGRIDLTDAVLLLTYLFLEPSNEELPVAPYLCCGFDPSVDDLDRYAADNSDPAPNPNDRDPARGSCVFPGDACP